MKITRNWHGKKKQVYELPEESRQRILKALRTRKISKKTIEHIANLTKGKFGKDHPCWKEKKKKPFHKQIRTLHKYRKWRTNIFEQDNYTCVLCGIRGNKVYIQADHYPKHFIDIIRNNKIDTIGKALMCEELWNAKGRTLCRKCHYDNFEGKERNLK